MAEDLVVCGSAAIALNREPTAIAARGLRVPSQRRGGAELQVALDPTAAWSLDVRRDRVAITVLEGEVMVTFEGDPDDHVLAAGAVFVTSGRGRVAVAAFRRSRFSVTPG